MKKRVVAFLNIDEFKIPSKKEVEQLNSKCIKVVGFHKPDTLITDMHCAAKVTGKEIDTWAKKLRRARD